MERKLSIPTKDEKRIAELEQENLTLKEAQAETNTTLLELMEVVILS